MRDGMTGKEKAALREFKFCLARMRVFELVADPALSSDALREKMREILFDQIRPDFRRMLISLEA